MDCWHTLHPIGRGVAAEHNEAGRRVRVDLTERSEAEVCSG